MLHEPPMNNAGNLNNVALDNSTSFKYKASLLGKATGNYRSLKNTKIVVPLKYLFNFFFRSLEMSLINSKIHLELDWHDNRVMYGANDRETTFQIPSTKWYVPVVTLSTQDNENLTKQLYEGFKRSIYWTEYKSKIETKTGDDNNVIRFPFDASFKGVNRLFVLPFDNTENGNKKVERDSHRKIFYQ